jgi:hypothetical protein
MSSSSSVRRTDVEVTSGQSTVGLPLMGEARRTDQTQTDVRLEDGDWILPLVKRAQEQTIKQAAAVRVMGIAKTQYIENLQGTGHLSIRRLGLLPQEFWIALHDELRAYYQLDNDGERLERAVECVNRGMQQIAEIARKGIK